jgi:hypothetical protein
MATLTSPTTWDLEATKATTTIVATITAAMTFIEDPEALLTQQMTIATTKAVVQPIVAN